MLAARVVVAVIAASAMARIVIFSFMVLFFSARKPGCGESGGRYFARIGNGMPEQCNMETCLCQCFDK